MLGKLTAGIGAIVEQPHIELSGTAGMSTDQSKAPPCHGMKLATAFMSFPADQMRIAIIGPPFIEIPPRRYGGTELFIANLACDVYAKQHEVTVYANGDSCLPCAVKWRYPHAEWPLVEGLVPETTFCCQFSATS